MTHRDDIVSDEDGSIIGVVYDQGKTFEAWARHRLRTGDTPGNSHKMLGTFDSYEDAMAAVLSSEKDRFTIPPGHLVCPECKGTSRAVDGNDCVVCNGQGFVAESSLR